MINQYRIAYIKYNLDWKKINLLICDDADRKSHFAENGITKIVIYNVPTTYDIVILWQCDNVIVREINFEILWFYDVIISWCCDLRYCKANCKIASSQIFWARYSRKIFSISWHLVMRFNANKWVSCRLLMEYGFVLIEKSSHIRWYIWCVFDI